MRLVNRALQREVLDFVGTFYPNSPAGYVLRERFTDHEALAVNVRYLEQHGLLNAQWIRADLEMSLRTASITEKGIDFLQGDGGLSALLGVVTIRVHEDTLKELIATRIDQADLPPTQKQRLQEALRELPAETTKHLALRLVDTGLANWPAALQTLQTLLG